MYDRKNSVLFTDTGCVVLSQDFKLTDESHVLLKVSRKDNKYNVDLKNVIPQGGLTCLFAKAIPDESNLWHSRLEHVNFKTINKLVKGNLVRGIENLIDLKVKVIRCDIGNEFKNMVMNQFCKMKGIKREFSVARTSQQNRAAERKNRTLIEAARTMLTDSKLPTTFWAKAVNTDCRKHALSFMRPFGCLVTILNTIDHLGTKACDDADKARMEIVPSKHYILLPMWPADPLFSQNSKSYPDAGFKPSRKDEKKVTEEPGKESGDSINAVDLKTSIKLSDDLNMSELEDIVYSDDDEDVGAETDMNNLNTFMPVSPILITRINKDHSVEQIIRDLNSTPQTRIMTKNVKEHAMFSSVQQRSNHKDFQNCLFACFLSQEEPKKVIQALKDPKEIDYDEVFTPVARIEAIRLFLAYASFKDFVVYQIDVKSAFLYGKIEEEVYVFQPPGYEDPNFPDRVYKLEKALYGLHQAPRAWYETLSTYLLDNGFQRGKIDKTLFIRRDKGDILLVQVYVNDIIFSSPKKSLCIEFEKIMHTKFQMSYMSELTFFLGLQVKQKEYGIFLSQGKIFRYLKGQPKLGLWYPKDLPFDLVQCKKQTMVANSTTEAEYIAASNCCGQTKHIEIRHHFIRDSNKKKLIQMIKIHAYQNVADLLTKAFDRIIHKGWLKWNATAARDEIEVKTGISRVNVVGHYLFWSTTKIKTVNNETQIHAKVEDKTIVIPESSVRRDLQFDDEDEVGEGSRQPTDPQHTSITASPSKVELITVPSSSQPKKTHRPRKAKRATKISQSSGPIPLVADETVTKEREDRIERAATTTSSLEAEQDSSNINRTQSMATLNAKSSWN
ncbi:putative ribonuclease H-like domain-containing protein [Tanacetum coccineum]|uniref:Ribonuclease H-like domain-containing protein n=1 Tax=Tanacetum coccineum TaxID=301880 RepID=A0ABQ5GQU5_9ASTR